MSKITKTITSEAGTLDRIVTIYSAKACWKATRPNGNSLVMPTRSAAEAWLVSNN